MTTKAKRDPHPKWWAEIKRIKAEENPLHDRIGEIEQSFYTDVEAGKIRVPSRMVEIGTDYGGRVYYSFMPRAPGFDMPTNPWQPPAKPIFAQMESEIDRVVSMALKFRAESRTRKHLVFRRRVKTWGARMVSELNKRQRAFHKIMDAYRDRGQLQRHADALFERQWELLDLLCTTRAKTIEGARAQAEVLASFFLEESDWTKKPDQKAARNIVATLSKLAKAA